MCDCIKLNIPGTDFYIRPGDRIKIGRFSSIVWVVSHGWYSWGGNRPFCGWYLTKIDDPAIVKPLQLTDLDDCYQIN